MKKLCSLLCCIIVLKIALTAQPEELVVRGEQQEEKQTNNVKRVKAGEVDVAKKTKEVEDMTKQAVAFFNSHTLEQAARDFGHNLRWRKGEIFPFILDSDGNVLVHGDDTYLIWQNLPQLKKAFGAVFEELKQTAEKGGWVHYTWYNGFKSVYVQQATKDGALYIIGSGFFPESQEYDTQRLVQDAAAMFKERGKDETLARVNNTFGQFVKGGMYVFIYDFKGNAIAHGENPALIGQNLINLKDSRGMLLIQELIRTAQTKEGKGWVDYVWKNSPKRAYVERIVDPKTKTQYLVGAGYHPTTSLDDVYAFVSRAIRHLKDVGAKQAFTDFSNPVGEYIKGDLSVFVYDFDGKVLSDGEHPEFVGQTLINLRDPEGKYIVKSILDVADKEGKGTVTYLHKNAYKSVFVEKVDLPDGKFVIGSGYYPASKSQATRSLVEKGVDYLKNRDSVKAFDMFKKEDGEFFRGDLHLFVYLADGTAMVNGLQTNMIWQNFAKARDDQGKNIVDELIALGRAGGGWATYKSRNATRRVFVRAIDKENQTKTKKDTYIIGSGYYL